MVTRRVSRKGGMWPFTRRNRSVAPAPEPSGAEFIGENSSRNVPMSNNNAKLSRKRWSNRDRNAWVRHEINGYNNYSPESKKILKNISWNRANRRGVMNNTMMYMRKLRNNTRRFNKEIANANRDFKEMIPKYYAATESNKPIIKSKMALILEKKRQKEGMKELRKGFIADTIKKLGEKGYNKSDIDKIMRNFNDPDHKRPVEEILKNLEG